MIIYFCLMMGKLLTTPMIYAECSIVILRILSIGVDDTIYQDDTCESCISDRDNHRSIGQIRNMMKLAHTDETHFSFKTVDVAVIKKHLKNIKINKATGHDLLPPKLLKLGSPILCFNRI